MELISYLLIIAALIFIMWGWVNSTYPRRKEIAIRQSIIGVVLFIISYYLHYKL